MKPACDLCEGTEGIAVVVPDVFEHSDVFWHNDVQVRCGLCFREKTKLLRHDECDSVANEKVSMILSDELIEVLYCECWKVMASAEMV